ncbi:MAG: T9SS type A sorting domain-containing protein [Chitinophagales bacterium]
MSITNDGSITDPAQIDAIRYVEILVDELLATSSNVVPIKIKVKFGQPFPSGSIASNGVIQEFSKDFTSNDPLFLPLTMYSKALANKLAKTNISPTLTEGDITILNLGNWYNGKDAHPESNQLDFVTMLLHEACHSLGFDAYSTTYTNNQYGYYFPSLSQLYVSMIDKFLINSSGTTLTSLPTPSTQVAAFFTSNDVYFNGSNAISYNNNTKPKMASNTRSHMVGGLMNPILYNGIAFHDLGPVGKGILKDLGWDISILTGYGDRLYFDPCYTGSYNPNCTQTFATLLNVGSSYAYNSVYEDNTYPYNNGGMSIRNWKVELFSDTGSLYTLVNNLNTPPFTQITIPSIPLTAPGRNWKRNEDGTIKAKITVYGYNYQNTFMSSSIIVGINTVPDKPLLNLYNNTCGLPWGRNSAKLSFYAPGAISYKLYIGSSPKNYVQFIDLPQGSNTYTLNGLGTGYFYIVVVGVNQKGASISSNEIVINTTCAVNSKLSSVQFDDSISSKETKVYINGNILNIENNDLLKNSSDCIISIVNILGQEEKTVKLINQQNNISIDLSDLQNGLYIINIITDQKIVFTKKIFINNTK